MMNRMKTVLTAAALLPLALTGCAGEHEETAASSYEDMQTALAQSGLMSATIGIFSKTEQGGGINYGDCGSGVIFEQADGKYYALTSAHVVSDENAQILVFTVNTDMKTETVPGLADMSIPSPDAYDAMYPAEKLYEAAENDLAVICFAAEETLSVMPLAENDPAVGDRILCLGHPENNWFAVSYGAVTSGIGVFGETQGYPSHAMRHSAYIKAGSSGGAAVNEQMQLTGIVPGGSFTPGSGKFRFGVLIPTSEIQRCLDEWRGQ